MNERSQLVELLKYPLVVASILVALIIARWTLGVSFGAVSEISSSGVKFAQEAPGKLADLEGRLNGALREIELLKTSEPGERGGRVSSAPAVNAGKVEVFAQQQTVSDQTAQLAKLGSAPGAAAQKGYIWIGDFSGGKWDRAQLASLQTGQPVTESPDQLRVGTEYKVLGNIIVRDGMPSNDAEYFRGRKSVGTVPRGSRVRLAATPVAINREYAVQYWAEIELVGS